MKKKNIIIIIIISYDCAAMSVRRLYKMNYVCVLGPNWCLSVSCLSRNHNGRDGTDRSRRDVPHNRAWHDERTHSRRSKDWPSHSVHVRAHSRHILHIHDHNVHIQSRRCHVSPSSSHPRSTPARRPQRQQAQRWLPPNSVTNTWRRR